MEVIKHAISQKNKKNFFKNQNNPHHTDSKAENPQRMFKLEKNY